MADDNIQSNQKSGEMPVMGALVGAFAFMAITYFIIQWMGSGMTRDY